jgi:hypothetical protein
LKASTKPLLFVSCGQSTEAERQLGKQICALIGELRPDVDTYFAENESTVEGLSNKILKALYKAAGFICVMHRRGAIEAPDKRTVIRGSVWVEQEIAVTAFMGHVLGRSIPTFFYKQAGIGVEGIRSVLVMNPRVEFTADSEVFEDLKLVLPSAVFNPFNECDILPVITHQRTGTGNGHRHSYILRADVKNVGNERITHFLMRVYFPRAFLNPDIVSEVEDKQYSTPNHICFATDETRAPGGLYPGQGMRNPLIIEYFVDRKLFKDAAAMGSKIRVELFSGSIHKHSELNIGDYQEF